MGWVASAGGGEAAVRKSSRVFTLNDLILKNKKTKSHPRLSSAINLSQLLNYSGLRPTATSIPPPPNSPTPLYVIFVPAIVPVRWDGIKSDVLV